MDTIDGEGKMKPFLFFDIPCRLNELAWAGKTPPDPKGDLGAKR
jgi:hypothetical protein